MQEIYPNNIYIFKELIHTFLVLLNYGIGIMIRLVYGVNNLDI